MLTTEFGVLNISAKQAQECRYWENAFSFSRLGAKLEMVSQHKVLSFSQIPVPKSLHDPGRVLVADACQPWRRCLVMRVVVAIYLNQIDLSHLSEHRGDSRRSKRLKLGHKSPGFLVFFIPSINPVPCPTCSTKNNRVPTVCMCNFAPGCFVLLCLAL